MKKMLFKMITGICVLLAVWPATAVTATVDFTEDGAARQASVYVAGNPDCYPVESYDSDSGTYKGAAPAFLALAAEQTDLNFVYIRAGEQDRRATLARNSQVDLLFATGEESALLDLGVEKIKLFSVTKNGTPTDVYCVFTSVSGEKERAAIRSVAENLTKDDIARLLTADSSRSVSRKQFWITIIVLGSVLLCVLVALAVFLVLFLKRNRRKEALVDSATEIGNKKYFLQMYGSAISDQTRELYYIVQFAFAIDFVNANFGAEESDKILRYAADAIKQRVKDNEFCARIGGGSFAAAIYASGVEQAERRVEEILRVLNAYGEKYMKGELKSLFHAGICALAVDDKNAEKVLYNVDQAYHRAVKDKIAYVFVNHDVLNEYKTKVSIREQAAEALEQHAFTPYVQFIVNAKDGSIGGAELLSRWENRLYGLLSPGSYIPILQDMGLIVRHDLLMLEEACKLLEQWQSRGKNYFLTCNLTRVTISDRSLVEKILMISGRYSFAKENLILEVTEDSIEEDKESALHNMLCLKEQGFRIALDDFSSGYTAVSNLYEYAVDLVKLDRQMIVDADHDPHAAVLMKEIAKLCHELQIYVLAEGVENEKQVRLVRSALCDYIQGYFFARALPLRELPGFEESYRTKAIFDFEDIDDALETVPTEDPAADQTETPAEEPSEASETGPIAVPLAVTSDESSSEAPSESSRQPAEASSAEASSAEASSAETHSVLPVEEDRSNEVQTPTVITAVAVPQPESTDKKNMLFIQFGPYRLALPANIAIDPVSEVLHAIQEQMMKEDDPSERP